MHGNNHDLSKSISEESTEQLMQMIAIRAADYRFEALNSGEEPA
jgi:hypothetical protein